MVELSYPGVCVAENPSTTRAITGASTSTAAFIGMTEKGSTDKSVLVTSLAEFFDKFGSFTTKHKMGITNAQENDVYLPYAVWAFFQNGGSKCYIVRIAPEGSLGKDVTNKEIIAQLTDGTSVLDKITDVSLIASPGYTDTEIVNAGFTYAEGHRNSLGDAFFIADVPKYVDTPDEGLKFIKSLSPCVNGFGAVYFPWIKVHDEISKARNPIAIVPPSGFMAGIFARIDNKRGVWKSPAGIEANVAGALDLTSVLDDINHGIINEVGLNAIRSFPDKGLVAWSARTPSSDIIWRYLSVRRMTNFLKSSIYDGIQWAVFESNDTSLWTALTVNIERFMREIFSQGAFKGSTIEEAFFVKCGSETTTSTDQQMGIVNVLVGFAPLKPAEFIVINLSLKVAPEI